MGSSCEIFCISSSKRRSCSRRRRAISRCCSMLFANAIPWVPAFSSEKSRPLPLLPAVVDDVDVTRSSSFGYRSCSWHGCIGVDIWRWRSTPELSLWSWAFASASRLSIISLCSLRNWWTNEDISCGFDSQEDLVRPPWPLEPDTGLDAIEDSDMRLRIAAAAVVVAVDDSDNRRRIFDEPLLPNSMSLSFLRRSLRRCSSRCRRALLNLRMSSNRLEK